MVSPAQKGKLVSLAKLVRLENRDLMDRQVIGEHLEIRVIREMQHLCLLRGRKETEDVSVKTEIPGSQEAWEILELMVSYCYLLYFTSLVSTDG